MTVQDIIARIEFHKVQYAKMVAMKCYNVAEIHQNKINELENLKIAR